MTSKTETAETRVTRDDLEAKLKAFQGGVQGQVEDRKSTMVAAGSVAAVVIVLIFFLLGKRSGKKKTTIVEIRRV